MRYPNHWSLYLYLPTIYWWQKCLRSRGVRIITFKWVQYTCTDTMKSSNFALLRHLWWSKSVSNIITHIITVENNRVMINIVIHSFRQWAWNYHKFNDDSIIILNMSATYIYIYIYLKLGEAGNVTLTQGKPAQELEPYPLQDASKAVDGDYFTRAITFEVNWPYWYVDLGQSYMVERVRLVVVLQGK